MWLHKESLIMELNESEKNRLDKNAHDCDIKVNKCWYCNSFLTSLGQRTDDSKYPLLTVYIDFCPICGWWVASSYSYTSTYEAVYRTLCRCSGILCSFDNLESDIPLNELSRYLVANFDTRYRIHPKKFEDVIGGIFADFDYKVRVTSYSRDEGIDIAILDKQDNTTIGVQVKRYKGRIKAENIRSFAGALILKGITQGVYVTTSEYQKGAIMAANNFGGRGINIELWDSHILYDKLRLSKQTEIPKIDDSTAPFFQYFENPKLIPLINKIDF